LSRIAWKEREKMPERETVSLAWRVEETGIAAWPALREVMYRGWLLRLGNGLSRRGNSANPTRGYRPPDPAFLAGCAAFYRRHKLPAVFRVPSLLDLGVAARLADAGYAAEGETCVLYGPLAALPAAPDPAVRLLPRPSPAWLAAMARLQGHTPRQARIYGRIVRLIAEPAAFAVLDDGGGAAALGYGVIHDGLLCYASVVTAPARRRRGLAFRLVAALAAWARSQDAGGACLQVEADNAPARALYDRFGLARELYRYCYYRAA
jgi:GNAT superfamily N-acetyltransferase